jgi:sec-independent protein translocase protein TatC
MAVQPPIDPIEDHETELGGQMSFLDHLEELRTRILRSLIALAVGCIACWIFVGDLLDLVRAPVEEALGEQGLVFTNVQGPFNLYVRIALIGGALLASPFLLAQVWLFIAPGLYRHERRFAVPFILSGTLLAMCGVLFGYFVVFPTAASFLIQWGRDLEMVPMLNGMEFVNFFLVVMASLAVIFQIPPVIFVLSRMGIVSAGFLWRNMKYAVLIFFVIAAVITPTGDAINLMLIAGPMLGLYIIGVAVAFLFGKREDGEKS